MSTTDKDDKKNTEDFVYLYNDEFVVLVGKR